jgi:gluconate 2-dehydrogenase gamma chain
MSTRRRFIGFGAVAATTVACGRKSSRWRFFTEAEARILAAMCDHIIPDDDRDPGAAWAGVPVYIDRQLTRFHKPHQQAYREGLQAVDSRSRGSFGHPFIELEREQQFTVLQEIEKDQASRPFFDLVVLHTMQGFYGPPRHGGNREAVSWRMLGLPYPPVRGRQI